MVGTFRAGQDDTTRIFGRPIQFGTHEGGNKSPINSIQFIERSISTRYVRIITHGAWPGMDMEKGYYTHILQWPSDERYNLLRTENVETQDTQVQWRRLVVFQFSPVPTETSFRYSLSLTIWCKDSQQTFLVPLCDYNLYPTLSPFRGSILGRRWKGRIATAQE